MHRRMSFHRTSRGAAGLRGLTVLAAASAALIAGVGPANAEAAPSDTTPDYSLNWGNPNARGGAAGGCVGYLQTPRVVNQFLEYSLHSTCGGTDWSPHRLTLVLEVKRKIPFFPDIIFRDALTDRSKTIQEGSPDITVFVQEPCIDTQERTYRINGRIEAGPHDSGKFLDTAGEVKLNCRVQNAG